MPRRRGGPDARPCRRAQRKGAGAPVASEINQRSARGRRSRDCLRGAEHAQGQLDIGLLEGLEGLGEPGRRAGTSARGQGVASSFTAPPALPGPLTATTYPIIMRLATFASSDEEAKSCRKGIAIARLQHVPYCVDPEIPVNGHAEVRQADRRAYHH